MHRIELTVQRAGFDVVGPKRDGRLVGNQQAFAGVFDKEPAHWILDAQVAEGIAAREVEQIGNGAKDFSLGAFAGAGRTEKQNGAVFCGFRVRGAHGRGGGDHSGWFS